MGSQKRRRVHEGRRLKAEMRMMSVSDVANCAHWVYSPVCVKREGSKSWADIEDRRYTNREIYVQIQILDDKI